MDISVIVLSAFILVLVAVIYGLGKRLNKAKDQIHDMELDLQEYIDAANKDAKKINELKTYVTKLEMEHGQ